MLIEWFRKLKQHKYFYNAVIIAIFCLAAFFRFTHLNWDQSLTMHPDERNITQAVIELDWPIQLDPKFYAYNGFPLFLTDISSQIFSTITGNDEWELDHGKLVLITRAYSAFFSFLSVFVIYFISKQFFKKKTQLLVTYLAATTVTFIQHAHFGVTESLLVLQLLILTWFSIKLIKTKTKKYVLWMAIITGLSVGTKTSALSFMLIPLLSIVMTYRLKLKTFLTLIFFLAISLLVFYTVSPNTFDHFADFLGIMKYERAVVNAQQPMFYTMQFIDTKPYLFHVKTLFWQTSIFIVLASSWGFYLSIKNKSKYFALWPFIIFSLLYFLYIGSWYAKFNRYLMPFIPVLIILAGVTLEQCRNKQIFKILAATLIISNGLWAFAFFNIYQNEHVRIVASSWIEKYFAQQSVILHEERDVRLPVVLTEDKNFQYLLLTLYQEDTPEKINTLTEQLAQGDYLIIASQRLYQSIPRSTDYPYTTRYYQLLFQEKLGYRLLTYFTAYPNLFGININDEIAEETFSVFDHPKILIFQNVERLSADEILAKIVKEN